MDLLRLSLLALLVACGGSKDDVDTAEPEPEPDTTDTYTYVTPDDCGATAPVVSAVTITNGGLIDPGDGTSVPSLLVAIDASDPDGDLHELGFELDLDTNVDGTLVAEVTLAGSGTVPDVGPCEVPALQGAQLLVAIDGTNIAYDTHYEIGIRMLDAALNISNTFVTDAITPHEDGTDGDGI